MTEQEFTQRFKKALEEAMQIAENQLHRNLPHQFRIRLHGANHSGDELEVDQVAKALYLGEESFYRIIDIAVVEVHSQYTVLFVRVSAHAPSSWERTWNNPPGNGPFKQLVSLNIKVMDD